MLIEHEGPVGGPFNQDFENFSEKLGGAKWQGIHGYQPAASVW